MHITIEITVPPTYTDTLTEELEQLEHMIAVSVLRGASIKPPGDVVTVHVLNRGADQVMSFADAARKGGAGLGLDIRAVQHSDLSVS